MLDQATIDKIKEWANGKDATDYNNKFFGPAFTEAVRRELRSMAIDNPHGVRGSWRLGYGIMLPDGSEIGVGTHIKGSRKFAIFYLAPAKYILPTAKQVAAW